MLKNKQKFIDLCNSKLKEKGLNDQKHLDRFNFELREIENQGEYDYFLALMGKDKIENENNLFIAYLLDICNDFDINKTPTLIEGEYPDIDIDYVPEVQKYLKNDWAPRTFGLENVCSIGNYTTFGIKSSMLDVARVYGKDRQEIATITKKIQDKDEEGEEIEWEKALSLYPDFKKYCDENPDVANGAMRLLDRNRGMGVHAGGLIVSNVSLDGFIPLVISKDGEEGERKIKTPVSAFVEGLSRTDLGPMGLIKFDILVVVDLYRISLCCDLIRKRHKVGYICSKSNTRDWDDTSYLNDKKSLKLADAGRTGDVFQFDKKTARKLLKDGGVDSFDDLVAYNAINRPATLNLGLHKNYANRKKGMEKYNIPDLIKPILEKTYGIMIYQEQVMQILHLVGNIPLSHCEKARKAISKKKEEIFANYKQMFIDNGQVNLGWSEEKVRELFQQVISFSEYGFNASHAVAYTYISSRLLWLKAHYPLEFFTATLECLRDPDRTEKFKNTRLDAKSFGIKINKVDINKSDYTFKIVDNEIYMGFSNVKGIGEEVAKKIVENQPYVDFSDFLKRFGTKANVIKPFIALGMFEGNKVQLYEYYEAYKKQLKKKEDKIKRGEKSIQEHLDNMSKYTNNSKELAKTMLDQFMNSTQKDFNESFVCNDLSNAWKIVVKYKRTVNNSNKEPEPDLVFSEYQFTGEIDLETKVMLEDIQQISEIKYFGFPWEHIIEFSPDYDGERNFSAFDDDSKAVVMIEAHICNQIKEVVSKKGNVFYITELEDSNGQRGQVSIWKEDYDRFKEEFNYWVEGRGGHLVKIRLQRPFGDFGRYTFESWPKQLRSRMCPAEKEKDYRLMLMKWPENKIQHTILKI